MKTTLINLTDANIVKPFIADEKFWENVLYVKFHSERLEVRYKNDLRTEYYLHDWFSRILEKSEVEPRKYDIYQKLECLYRFSEENKGFLNYLYDEAKKRQLIQYS